MLQDQFLDALAQSRVPVTIYLVNGIRLQGEIESYDQYGVMLSGSSQQLIYKHAISTVVPIRDISTAGGSGEQPATAAVVPAHTLRVRRTRSS